MALAVAAAVLLGGCTADGPTVAPSPIPSPSTTGHEPNALRPFYDQRANWSDCGQFECATIEAPLAYDRQAARRIRLSMLKRPADNQSDKIGTLFVNPGGPGVSGIQYARLAEVLFTQPVLENYDIVGWDPRGVGASTAISCLTDGQTDRLLAADGTPDNSKEVATLVRLNTSFTRGCERDDSAFIPQLGTFNSARDMDLLRAAVGEPRLNYFGASYGTELGAVYADLFPQRVGRMVLDGALDPAISSSRLAEGQLKGFQQATEAFIEDCITRDGCVLGPTLEEAETQLTQLLSDIDKQPLSTDSERPLTEALATTGMISAMYSESSGWPSLRLGLSQAFQGDGTVLLALADAYSERNSDGTYASNVNSAFPAIACTDRPGSQSLTQIRRTVPKFEQVSPIFGRTFAWSGLSCRDWPVKKGHFPTRVAARGSAPIVVIGTTRDPATPYQWAVRLAHSLQSGVLISRDGDGHTGYNANNECVDTAVDDYLVAGTVPDDPTRC
ncbi:MAG: alpha/beta hydrolase [Actinomycetes bacterium]